MRALRRITLVALIALPIGWFVANINHFRASRKLSLARHALSMRDTDLALDAILEAAQLDPNNGEISLCMARAYRRRGELDKVRQSLEKAKLLRVSRDRIDREEWLALAQSGQMGAATLHLAELLVNPGEDGPDICEAYANGYFLTFQLADAFRILDAWEKDYPHDAQPHVFRAAFSSKIHDWNSTATHLIKANALAPERNDIRIELATTLLILRRTEEAATQLEHLRRSRPDHPDVLVGWAQILLERGQVEDARLTLEHLLQVHPKHVAAFRLLGEVYQSSGRLDQAIELFQQAVAIKSNDTEARYSLGTALQKAGRNDEARHHFEFVARSNETQQRYEQLLAKVRKQNDDVGSRFEISELLRDFGEPRDRLLWLRSVVALAPSHRAAHAELAKCYATMGMQEESEKHRKLAEE